MISKYRSSTPSQPRPISGNPRPRPINPVSYGVGVGVGRGRDGVGRQDRKRVTLITQNNKT